MGFYKVGILTILVYPFIKLLFVADAYRPAVNLPGTPKPSVFMEAVKESSIRPCGVPEGAPDDFGIFICCGTFDGFPDNIGYRAGFIKDDQCSLALIVQACKCFRVLLTPRDSINAPRLIMLLFR